MQKEFDQNLKKAIVAEYQKGGITKAKICQKYNIKGHGTLDRWLSKFADNSQNSDSYKSEIKATSQGLEEIEIINLDSIQDDYLQLQVKLAEKEKELSLAQNKIMAYEALIIVANRKYETDLKKNFGHLQFKK